MRVCVAHGANATAPTPTSPQPHGYPALQQRAKSPHQKDDLVTTVNVSDRSAHDLKVDVLVLATVGVDGTARLAPDHGLPREAASHLETSLQALGAAGSAEEVHTLTAVPGVRAPLVVLTGPGQPGRDLRRLRPRGAASRRWCGGPLGEGRRQGRRRPCPPGRGSRRRRSPRALRSAPTGMPVCAAPRPSPPSPSPPSPSSRVRRGARPPRRPPRAPPSSPRPRPMRATW